MTSSIYTRQNMIQDGYLVDVTKTAKQHHASDAYLKRSAAPQKPLSHFGPGDHMEPALTIETPEELDDWT